MTFNFKGKLFKNDSNLMNHRIEVPDDLSEKFIDKNTVNSKRVVCIFNNKITLQIALIADGKGSYYLIINKETRKKLNIDIGDFVEITISKDNSKYGIAFPLEMEELMKLDDLGRNIFHNLTPGKQRSLLYLISKPKSEAIRIKKAVVILEYLKSVNGKLDHKELNIAFKNANR